MHARRRTTKGGSGRRRTAGISTSRVPGADALGRLAPRARPSGFRSPTPRLLSPRATAPRSPLCLRPSRRAAPSPTHWKPSTSPWAPFGGDGRRLPRRRRERSQHGDPGGLRRIVRLLHSLGGRLRPDGHLVARSRRRRRSRGYPRPFGRRGARADPGEPGVGRGLNGATGRGAARGRQLGSEYRDPLLGWAGRGTSGFAMGGARCWVGHVLPSGYPGLGSAIPASD